MKIMVNMYMLLFSSPSVMSDSLRPHGPQHTRLPCPSLFLCLLKHMSIESVMPSNYLILCRPLLLLPSIFPSIRAFSNEWALCIRWPEYWSFSFSISTSSEYSGLVSFRIDWFDLLAIERTCDMILALKLSWWQVDMNLCCQHRLWLNGEAY